MCFQIVTKGVEPTMIALCELEAQNIGILVSNQAIEKVMAGVQYSDLITLEKEESGKILALKANTLEMSKMATEISSEMQSIYNQMESDYIRIPLGNFSGNALLSGLGPNVTIRIIPFGTVATKFKSDFISTGINQVRHRIYLEITTQVSIVAPLITKQMPVVNDINVAETVLVGDVPESFYNLEGVKEITADDSLNLW
ncbi:MAG: sporulation protein YunB [Clostridia bacterium]|nr:sporulation protein YunB [Clostridia bacterium]